MKKMSLAAASLFFAASAFAQNPPAPPKPPGTNTVIVIEDGIVTINGKPVEKSADKKTIVVTENGTLTIDGETVVQTDGAMHVQGFRMDNYPYLGVGTNAEESGGELRISSVSENSPAAKAGLQKGDILTKIDGKQVKSFAEMNALIRGKKANDVIDIEYTRDGKKQKTSAKLATRNAFGATRSLAPRVVMGRPLEIPENFNYKVDDFQLQFFRFGQPKYGMQVEDRAEGDGVVVVGITEGSNAEKAGLKKGDIIVSINKNPVSDITALMEELGEETDGKAKAFQVTRDGKQMDLTVAIPKTIRSANL